ANYSQSLQGWLENLSTSVQTLHRHVLPEKIASLPARGMVAHESRQWSKLSKQLYAYHFDLMMRSGMADEWMGVAPGEPNPVRDYVRLYLSTGVWRLVTLGTPEAPLPTVTQ